MAQRDVAEQNKAAARAVTAAACSNPTLEAANRAVGEFFAKDFVIHPSPPGISPDIAGSTEWNAVLLKAFPDFNVTIEDQFAEDDKVVTRWTARGTHRGEFQGIVPTGRQATVTGITISRYADGKVKESWVELDTLNMMRQLGASSPIAGGRGGVTFNITINE